MVEFRAFKLAFKGPGSTRVRFCREAVVSRGDRLGDLFCPVHRTFVGEAFLRVEGGLHSVFSAGGSESNRFVLRQGGLRLRQGGVLEV